MESDGGPTAGDGEWDRVLDRLRQEVGDTAWRSWLLPLSARRGDDGRGIVVAPTRFLREWVATHYAGRLLYWWRAENPEIRHLAIVVAAASEPPRTCAPRREGPMAMPVGAPPPMEAAPFETGEDKPPPASLDQRFTFDTFVVGKPNELAHAAARRVAEACAGADRMVPFNPLFLYGGVGLGKTHLMHAIAWHVRTQAPERKVIYLSAEMFMYQFIRALRFKSTMDFKDQFRSVDLLMVDDLQFISGKESTQEEFFHTFNALVDQNRQIVISADKS
ncbi:MAG TPA: DnaA/Hda family protein, partial [Stellaceae bacterium]